MLQLIVLFVHFILQQIKQKYLKLFSTEVNSQQLTLLNTNNSMSMTTFHLFKLHCTINIIYRISINSEVFDSEFLEYLGDMFLPQSL